MAFMEATQAGNITLGARVQKLVAEFKEAQSLRSKYRETINELRRLSDRELNDLGLNRYDFDAIAREHVYGA